MPVVSEISVLALADLDVVLVSSHASASSAKSYPRQLNAMPVSGAFKGLHECKARCKLGFGGWGRAGLEYIHTSYRLLACVSTGPFRFIDALGEAAVDRGSPECRGAEKRCWRDDGGIDI